MPIMPTAELYRTARIRVEDRIPEEWRESLPVPRRSDKGLQLCFFFCPAASRPMKGVELAPPDHLVTMNASTGAVDRLEAVSPSTFQQSDSPDKPLGIYAMSSGWTFDVYMAKQDRLFSALDTLLPAFASGIIPKAAKDRGAAEEYWTLFLELREPMLAPYYDALGTDFATWLGKVKGR